MKIIEELQRHQILLYQGDFERLSSFYRRRKATEVIRILVRRHLEEIDARIHKDEEEYQDA